MKNNRITSKDKNRITFKDKALNEYSKAVAKVFNLCWLVNPKSGVTQSLLKHYINTRQKITSVYCVVTTKRYVHYGNHYYSGMTPWKISQGIK